MCNQSPISVLDYVVTKMMLLLKPIDFNIHKIQTIFLKKNNSFLKSTSACFNLMSLLLQRTNAGFCNVILQTLNYQSKH